MLGTPQTSAGENPCTPLGWGNAPKLTPMGDTPISVNLEASPRPKGVQGSSPGGVWGAPNLFLITLLAAAGGEEKRCFGDTPNPTRGGPLDLLGTGRRPLS